MAFRIVISTLLFVSVAASDDTASMLQQEQWPGTRPRPTQPPAKQEEQQPAATQQLVIQLPQQGDGASAQPLVIQIPQQAVAAAAQVEEKPRMLAEVDAHEEVKEEKKVADEKSAFEKEHIYIPKTAHDPYKHGKKNNENTEEWYHSINSWSTWFKKKMNLWQKYRPFDAQVYKKWLDDIKGDAAQRCKWIGTGGVGGMKTTDDLYAGVTQCMWGMMMASQPLPPFTPPFVQKLLMEEQAEIKQKMADAGVSTEGEMPAAGQQLSKEMEMSIAASTTSPLKNQWMFALIPHIHRSEGWDVKHR